MARKDKEKRKRRLEADKQRKEKKKQVDKVTQSHGFPFGREIFTFLSMCLGLSFEFICTKKEELRNISKPKKH